MEMAFSVKSGLLAKRRVQKADSTLRSSRAVPHPSTNRALRRLTSEVRRDPVHSTRYGRQRALSLCCTVIENGYGRESVSASPPPCPPSRPSPLLASFPHYPEGPVQKADSTLRSSRAVPHPSTNRALRRLTSEVRRDPVHSTRYGRQRALSLHCRVKQMVKQRCRFCLLETTGRPPGDHRETAGRPPGDRRETARRPPGDRRETAGRPPGDRRETAGGRSRGDGKIVEAGNRVVLDEKGSYVEYVATGEHMELARAGLRARSIGQPCDSRVVRITLVSPRPWVRIPVAAP